jgi:hypothetical protein
MQLIKAISKTVSAATASGICTVDATDVVWPGQIGWLSKSGVVSERIQVTEILSATTFRATILASIKDDNFCKVSGSRPAAYPNAMFSDLSGFNGGSATFSAESQVVRGLQTVASTSLTTV